MGERTLTDADIKAIFAESDKQSAKANASIDRLTVDIEDLKTLVAKTTEQVDKTIQQMAKSDEKFADMREELGNIGHNNGLVAEEIVYHSLAKDMVFAGIKFETVDHGTVRSRKLSDGKKVKGEYDVLLYNGTSVAIIEVKHRVGRDALTRLVEVQLPRFRQIFPEYKDCKMYLGLGGMSFEKGIAEEAHRQGIATLTLSGDAVEIDDKDVKAW